jgi:hypothetical protein
MKSKKVARSRNMSKIMRTEIFTVSDSGKTDLSSEIAQSLNYRPKRLGLGSL